MNVADNSRQIFAELSAAGYFYIDNGYDSTVWGRDDGEVLKVIMPSFNKDQAERSFMLFHDTCLLLRNNPHVPKFIDQCSIFQVNNTDYLQVTMEQLYPIEEGSVDQAIVWALSDIVFDEKIQWSTAINRMYDPLFWENSMWDQNNITTLLQDINTYESLFETMRVFRKIARENEIGWDLHTENVMKRLDGTLVITDPFAA